MTEFGKVGKAVYDFPRVVRSIRGSVSHDSGAVSRQSQIFELS
jgi:hypothetical protein